MNISITTPGKLNLYLKVTQRRADGYHALDTLFMPIPAINDIVTLTQADELAITSDLNELPTGKANICYQAAIAYAAVAGLNPAWHIHLEKKIPVAAGMGGGSSDAAAVLRLLQQHYQALNDDELQRLALQLGADVPFFLNPCVAQGCGIGEQLTPLVGKFPVMPLLIIFPRFPVSAAWAYQNLAPENIASAPKSAVAALVNAWRNSEWDKMGKLFHNDLGFALFNKFPLLKVLREQLLNNGACGVEISGSGPSLFALFNNHKTLSMTTELLSKKYPEIRMMSP